jgi:hypothetical protein
VVTNANRILLRGDAIFEEERAGAAITPGHLIERYNDAGSPKVRKHSTAKGFAEKFWALEDALQGKTIDDAYAAADLVFGAIPVSGGIVQAYLKAGTNYVEGDKLESAGDGTLQKITGTADLQILATLIEPVDLSGSGAVATRADVRVH